MTRDSGPLTTLPARPLCACHDRPMWRGGKGRWVCAVAEGARNRTRMRTGTTFIGREHQFPAPREAIVAFVQKLKEATLGTHE